jgi:hypothetical protein
MIARRYRGPAPQIQCTFIKSCAITMRLALSSTAKQVLNTTRLMHKGKETVEEVRCSIVIFINSNRLQWKTFLTECLFHSGHRVSILTTQGSPCSQGWGLLSSPSFLFPGSEDEDEACASAVTASCIPTAASCATMVLDLGTNIV